MAPLPANNTATLFLDYTTCGEPHTALLRYGTGGSATDAMTVMHNFLSEQTASIYLLSVAGARVRDLGGSVSYPVTWTGDATYGAGAGPHYASAWYIDWIGRSLGGRRGRIAVFGAKADFDGGGEDFRYDASAFPFVAASIAALAADSNVGVAIDGDPINWQQYANIGTNAYWRNHIR